MLLSLGGVLLGLTTMLLMLSASLLWVMLDLLAERDYLLVALSSLSPHCDKGLLRFRLLLLVLTSLASMLLLTLLWL